jgi:iron complex outermembrane receptor protein
MNTSVSGIAAGLAAAAAMLPGATPASAEEAAGGLEEVVVTARRTAENNQTVPVAVSAFTAESLASKGVDDIAGVARYAPNVTLNFTAPISGASSALVAYIRGIGQPDFAINFEPGVRHLRGRRLLRAPSARSSTSWTSSAWRS